MGKAIQLQQPTEEMVKLLKATGSANRHEALTAMRALAAALETPLKQGVLAGDIVGDIFNVENLQPGSTPEYPLDFYQPGMEGQYVAYTLPAEGTIPTRHVQGDSVTVQCYDIASSIDWLLKYSREARWNIVARAMEVLEAGFVKKMNSDAWRVLIGAGYGRGLLVTDSAASAGQFTKRLVSLMKTTMRRKAGGNTTSRNQGQLTDLYVSLEAMEDIREWSAYGPTDGTKSMIDPQTMREIFTSENGTLSRIYGVNLHDISELGEGQEFQAFFEAATGSGGLGVAMGGDKEIVVGLDMSKNDSFVCPVKEPLSVFEDPALHRRRRAGVYAWLTCGFACLDPRRVLIGKF